MLEWLSGSQAIRTAVRKLIAEATRLDIAVAFWGRDSLSRLDVDVKRSAALRIIANLTSGGTNPAALKDVWEKVGASKVKQLNDLHAKVFISDHALILGSANVSANGLGLEGSELDGWREACLLTTASPSWETHSVGSQRNGK